MSFAGGLRLGSVDSFFWRRSAEPLLLSSEIIQALTSKAISGSRMTTRVTVVSSKLDM